MLCCHYRYLFPKLFHHPKQQLCTQLPPRDKTVSPSPQSLVTANLLSVSMSLPIPDILCKWNPIILVLFCVEISISSSCVRKLVGTAGLIVAGLAWKLQVRVTSTAQVSHPLWTRVLARVWYAHGGTEREWASKNMQSLLKRRLWSLPPPLAKASHWPSPKSTVRHVTAATF